MVSIKYIDLDFKTFVRVSESYLRTLREIRAFIMLELDIAGIYLDAEMWSECDEHLLYVEYLRELFDSLVEERGNT